jgi:serine/threonine protein kinase
MQEESVTDSPTVHQYQIGQLIGHGSFGKTYRASHVLTHRQVAVKFEPQDSRNPQLLHESRVYRYLSGAHGFCSLYWFGRHNDGSVMVLDLLSKSLSTQFAQCGHVFSLKTVLMIADEVLSRIEFLHRKGIVHRDIQPGNLLLGRGSKSNVIHLIDFGLSARFRDEHGNHRPFRENQAVVGTARFISINAHLGIEQSRRDDMESIAYLLVYFMKRKLPWQGLAAETPGEKYNQIATMKMRISTEELCRGLPKEFGAFVDQVRSLRFDDEPDYSFYRRIFRNLLISEGFVFDFDYDWLNFRPSDESPL